MGLFELWNDQDMRNETISLALTGGKKAIFCNFIGTAPKGGRMGPFAGGMGGHPPMKKQPSAPKQKQPVGPKSASTPAPAGRGIKFNAPKEWERQGATETRVASFVVKNGNDTGEVTVMDLRHGKDDLKATVDIWRNAIGLEPIDRGELAKQVKPITIQSGQQGHYIELAGKTSSLLGTLVVNGELVWVIKLKGSAALVQKERTRFRTFIQSLRFPKKD